MLLTVCSLYFVSSHLLSEEYWDWNKLWFCLFCVDVKLAWSLMEKNAGCEDVWEHGVEGLDVLVGRK